MPSSLAVQARKVSKIFEGGVGAHDLDLDVPAGAIFGFIGPSGSGKTTTVRLFTGVVARDTGDLNVLGEDPSSVGGDHHYCWSGDMTVVLLIGHPVWGYRLEAR